MKKCLKTTYLIHYVYVYPPKPQNPNRGNKFKRVSSLASHRVDGKITLIWSYIHTFIDLVRLRACFTQWAASPCAQEMVSVEEWGWGESCNLKKTRLVKRVWLRLRIKLNPLILDSSWDFFFILQECRQAGTVCTRKGDSLSWKLVPAGFWVIY